MLNNVVPILGNGGGAAGAATFVGLDYLTGYNNRNYGTVLDGSNNLIFAGSSSAASGDQGLIASIGSTGTSLNWQRYFTDTYSSHATRFQGIGYDGTNFYAGGYGNQVTTGAPVNACLVKYNSTGSIQWQRYLYDTLAASSQNDRGRAVATDSSGNSYFVGEYWNASSGINAFLAKYDNAGTLSFKVKLADSNTASNQATFFYGAVTDGTSVFLCGQTATAGGNGMGLIAKYNSSGTLQWQRTITDPSGSTSVSLRGITYDSSGNIYVSGRGQSAVSSFVGIIAKYNSSGTLQWQRTITDPNATPSVSLYGAVVDSSGNLYISGYGRKSSSTITDGFIAKYDTSGSLQWQKTIAGFNLIQIYGIALETGGANIVISGLYGNAAGFYDAFILRYPTSGSKTGTYTVYSTNTVTIATSTWTGATSTWTDAAGTCTASTATDLNAGTLTWTDSAGGTTYAGVAI